jgi:hypothetical protein
MPNLPYTLKVLDSECENAIIDFPFHEHIVTWLSDHKKLFESVSHLMNDALKINDLSDKLFTQQFYLLYLEKSK